MAGSDAGPGGVPAGTPRGGARRAAKPKRRLQPRLVGLGLGAFAALVAWGVLVWLAIDWGRSARGGDSARWGYLAGASVAAVLCLFGCLWLVTLLLRGLGILEPTERPDRADRADRPERSGQPHRH